MQKKYVLGLAVVLSLFFAQGAIAVQQMQTWQGFFVGDKFAVPYDLGNGFHGLAVGVYQCPMYGIGDIVPTDGPCSSVGNQDSTSSYIPQGKILEMQYDTTGPVGVEAVHMWWRVDFDTGPDGWVIAGTTKPRFVKPEDIPKPEPEPAPFTQGQCVKTTITRSSANFFVFGDSNINVNTFLGSQQAGALSTIQGGPVEQARKGVVTQNGRTYIGNVGFDLYYNVDFKNSPDGWIKGRRQDLNRRTFEQSLVASSECGGASPTPTPTPSPNPVGGTQSCTGGWAEANGADVVLTARDVQNTTAMSFGVFHPERVAEARWFSATQQSGSTWRGTATGLEDGEYFANIWLWPNAVNPNNIFCGVIKFKKTGSQVTDVESIDVPEEPQLPRQIPTPTPTPSAITIGTKVEVVTDSETNLNVRDFAGGTKIGSQPHGTQGCVAEGPTSSGTHTWFRTDFTTGADGWVAGDFLKSIGTCTPDQTQTGAKFQVGDTVAVTEHKIYNTVNMRGPEACGAVLWEPLEGIQGTIDRASPITCGGGVFNWPRWHVDFGGGNSGWVVEWRLKKAVSDQQTGNYCTPPFAAPGGWTALISVPTGNNYGVESFGTTIGPRSGETKFYKIPIDRDLESLRVRFNELQEPFGADFKWRFWRGKTQIGSDEISGGTIINLTRGGRDVGVSGDPDKGNYYLEIKNAGTSLNQFFLGWTSNPVITTPVELSECNKST